MKCRCEAEAGKAWQSCNTSGNVDPLDFYEQTYEVSQWMKIGGAQPCPTSGHCLIDYLLCGGSLCSHNNRVDTRSFRVIEGNYVDHVSIETS